MEMTMEKLVEKLNNAAKEYYSGRESGMSDKEYDRLYDELLLMESETGKVLPNSPTRNVGYEVVSELAKKNHEQPALSLDKTKDREALAEWLGDKEGCLSWKCDGLTIVLTYDVPNHFFPYQEAELQTAVTRGNGIVGEDVTHNAPFIEGIPSSIGFSGKMIVRGEVMTSFENFEKINESIADPDEKYKNPRNLTSGSLRMMDSKKAAVRHMMFKAFELVYMEGDDDIFTHQTELSFLKSLGFSVVENVVVNAGNVVKEVGKFEKKVEKLPYPTDGLVLTYNDIAYGRSLGTTGKYPKGSIAFKWADETEETVLRDVEWSASASGLLNPVAVFDPVELDGATVKRASIHNVRYLQNMELGYGDVVTIYRSNMVIPQLDKNLTKNGNYIKIPDTCPVCGAATKREVSSDGESEFLKCTNPECAAKHVGRFERLVCRDGLNVVGLAGSAIEDFLSSGFIHAPSDIFHLSQHKDAIIAMEGYGKKSYEKLISSVEKARHTTFRQFFYSLGIPGVGHDVAKILEAKYNAESESGHTKTEMLEAELNAPEGFDSLKALDGIGDVRAKAMVEWWTQHKHEYFAVKKEIFIDDDKVEVSQVEKDLAGLTFVITGGLSHYNNRDELKHEIESRGGKVSGSVSKNTSFLINNDVSSTTGKNKKAKELGIPVISEEYFIAKVFLEK